MENHGKIKENKMIKNTITTVNPFEEMDMAFDKFDNLDNMWMQIFNSPISTFKKFRDCGISVIDRPHNVFTIKDKNGNVIGNKLEVVTTPFKKDEVSVEISNGTLIVKCDKFEETKDESEELSAFEIETHHGISSQSYSFSLKLSDKVNTDEIKAENKDGMLTITLPFFKEEKKEEVKKIKVL